MPFGTEVGLGPGDTVRWGTNKRGHSPRPPPTFRPVSVVAKWLDGSSGTKVGLGPGHIVLNGDPASLPKEKGTQLPTPNFRPMSIVAKWSTISATASTCVKLGI